VELVEVLQELPPVPGWYYSKDCFDIGLVDWGDCAPQRGAFVGDNQYGLPLVFGVNLSLYEVVSNHSLKNNRDTRLSDEELVYQLCLVHSSLVDN